MIQKLKRVSAALLAVVSMAVLTGCRSDGYYQEKAVNRAREFLLEERPDIPFEEQEYIKFNRPFILVSELDSSRATGREEFCISWMVPNNPNAYLVYGVSGHRMIDWHPKQVICKNFKEPAEPYRAAAGAASEYILQNYFGLLSVESVNHIRYTMPGIWKCTFALDSNPESPVEGEALEKASQKPRYAMAWVIHEKDQALYVVRIGTANDDMLTGFQPYVTAIMNEADFRAGVPDMNPVIEPFGGKLASGLENSDKNLDVVFHALGTAVQGSSKAEEKEKK